MTQPNNPLTSRDKKRLRQIAHHLDAVVTIAEQGVSDGVIQEAQRALADHELIKVKVALLEKVERTTAAQTLATACDASVVQSIGKMAVLYKPNPKANPRLSNLARFG